MREAHVGMRLLSTLSSPTLLLDYFALQFLSYPQIYHFSIGYLFLPLGNPIVSAFFFLLPFAVH